MFEREESVIAKSARLRFYPMVVSRASGVRIWDTDGKEYIDFNSGGSVANLGYVHPDVTNALIEQAQRMNTACFPAMASDVVIKLAEKIVEIIPGKDPKRVWLGCTGSDANDWLAKIIPFATKKPKIVTFIGGYHGQTVGSTNLSGLLGHSRYSTSQNVVKAPFPYCYRCPLGLNEERCELRCFIYFKNYLCKTVVDPSQVGAVLVESIQADAGVLVPPPPFLRRLKEFCTENHILLAVDEVLTGFGRTGKMWGFEHEGIEPDIVLMGKALGSGIPMSAVVGPKSVMDAEPASYLLTLGGNMLGAATALATIDTVLSEKIPKKVQSTEEMLRQFFVNLKNEFSFLGDFRGKGLLFGLEIIELDGAPSQKLAHKICYAAWKNGLVIYYLGLYSNCIIISPPLIIGEQDLQEGLRRLRMAFTDVAHGKIRDEDVAPFSGW